MQSLKSRIILGLFVNQHLFKFQFKRKPFDPSFEALVSMREKTEKAATRFGKIPQEIEITPTNTGSRYAEWVKLASNPKEKVMLYFHGGFYMIGSPQSHRQHVVKFVQEAGINALVFDYRLAPEHPFPAGLEDALEAYEFLLSEGFTSKNMVFAGDSAGGGLCLATLLALKEQGKELPKAAAVLSPWTDLLLTGKSHQFNKKKCFSPIGCAESASKIYAGTYNPKNPLISPLYGDLKGLPPLHISAGGNETLLDDSVMFAEKARAAGVLVTFRSDAGMCHCYPAFGNMFRESRIALAEICQHLKKHINE